ncbi:MerR family transcriptional regulator [Chitinimonas sp. JJ19]|uniref:MerR family transcriptional regulator n=1 Tax=Chitinimonas sp. JJ19 TaxID=3109352 RepID=UPI003000D15D
MQVDQTLGLNISAVERETGLSKELLRIWERRYGFPLPGRDAQGDRVYPPEQVEKLRLVRRLLDRGLRPSKIVRGEVAELAQLLERMGSGGRHGETGADIDPLIECLARRDLAELQRYLQGELVVRGLRDFVAEFMPQANNRIGEAWFSGEISAWQEHSYVEQISQTVRMAVNGINQPLAAPRVLLTTPSGEQHGLGLLMVEAMLRMQGCQTWSLGTSLPLDDMVEASCELGCDILALSLSSTFPVREAGELVAVLRQRLPSAVSLWLGGAGVGGLKRLPPNVLRLERLIDIAPAVGQWRAEH